MCLWGIFGLKVHFSHYFAEININRRCGDPRPSGWRRSVPSEAVADERLQPGGPALR